MRDFDGFTDNTIYLFTEVDNVVMSTGGTIYNLLIKVGIWGVIISFVAVGISFLVVSDPKRRDELKRKIITLGIVAVCLSSFSVIIGLIGTLAQNIF